MKTLGKVASLWRYPVKSMRGEELPEAYVNYTGVYGDRLFAIRSSGAEEGFPYLTGRELNRLLLYSPRYRETWAAAKPANLAAAESIEPGITPIHAEASALALEVETPDGTTYAFDDPALLAELQDQVGEGSAPQLATRRPRHDRLPPRLAHLQPDRRAARRGEWRPRRSPLFPRQHLS